LTNKNISPKLQIMKIGDKLYRVLFTGQGIATWSYECIEIRQSKETTLWVMECQACSHGSKCHVLVSKVLKDRYAYVGMVNNEEEDYWHQTFAGDEMFFATVKEARAAYCDKRLAEYRKKLEDQQKAIDFTKRCIQDMEEFKKND